MTKTEKILKAYQKMDDRAVSITYDHCGFYYIKDANGNTIKSGDLIKGTRGIGGMKTIK